MKLVTVCTALNPAHAELVRSRLEASGFFVVVKNRDAAFAMDGYAMAAGGILVQTPEDEAEDARELVRSLETDEEDGDEESPPEER